MPASMLRGLRFVPDKPCDIISGYRGSLIGIEGKQMKKFEAFGLRHMRPSQITHLDEMVRTGNQAYVFLNLRIKPDKKTGQPRINRLLIFNWARWRVLWAKASLKKSHIERLPGIKGKNGEFDLRGFLGGVERANGKRT